MKRKEEINEQCFVNGFNDHDKEIFTIGVEWADSRPRKGLVDIDKAYEWIADHITEYLDRSDWMAEEFRKAMEE